MTSCIRRSFDFLHNLYTTWHVHHYQCVLQSLSNDMCFNVLPNIDYTKKPYLRHEPCQHPKNSFCEQSLVHKMDINLKSMIMINMIEYTFPHNRTHNLESMTTVLMLCNSYFLDFYTEICFLHLFYMGW
jgi:hypothetical protein